MKICKKCGKVLDKDELFCSECGTKAENEVMESNLSAGKEKMYQKKKLLIVAGIVICFFIIGVIVFLFINDGKDNESEETDKQETEIQDKEIEAIDESEYIFPYSDKEYLADTDVENLTEEQLGFARNEIIARHGRIFTDEKYKPYFEEKSWYEGIVEPEAFDADYENQLNEIEKANIEIIKKYEERFQINALAEQYYAGILKEYQDAEAGGFSGSVRQYPHLNPLLINNGCKEPLYYTLVDLCEDGVPELFIGYPQDGDTSGYNIIELYGYENGSARQLVVVMGFGEMSMGERYLVGERVQYELCEEGFIKETGREGADVDVTYYELEESTAKLGITGGAGRNGEGYYERDYGGFGVMEATEEFFESMQNKYPVRTDVNWYKLQELEIAVQEDYSFHAEKAYESVLQQYRNQKGKLMTGGDVDLNQNGIDDFTEDNPDLNRNVFGSVGELPEGLSYAFIDIDGNGIEELFIADVAGNNANSYTVYDIYTCVFGIPRRVFDAYDMGTYSFYFACENGAVMKVQKEKDSTWYGNLFYKITENSANAEFIDGIWIYPGSILGAQYSKSETCMADDAEAVDKAYYDTLINTYPVKEDIEWMKL